MQKKTLCMFLAVLFCLGTMTTTVLASAEDGSEVAVNVIVTGAGTLSRETSSGEWETVVPGTDALSCRPGDIVTLCAAGTEGAVPSLTVDQFAVSAVGYSARGSLYAVEIGSEDTTIEANFSDGQVWDVTVNGNGDLFLMNPYADDGNVPVASGSRVPLTEAKSVWVAFPEIGHRLLSLTLNGRELETEEYESGYGFTLYNLEPGDLVATFDAAEDVSVSVTIEGDGSVRYAGSSDGDWTELPPGGGTITAPAFSSLEFVAAGQDGALPMSFTEDGARSILPSSFGADGVYTMYDVRTEDVSLEVTFAEVPALDVTIQGEGALVLVYETIGAETQEIDVAGGSRIPAFQLDQSWEAMPYDDCALLSLTLNGEPVPFDRENNNAFSIPANTPGELVAVFGSESAAVHLSPEAPEDLALEDSEDGILLTGLIAAPAADAPLMGDLRNWLVFPADASVTLSSPDDAVIGTGAQADVTYEGETTCIQALVKGDVLGTGVMNIAQLTRMAASLNGENPLEGLFLLASDWNGSGAVDIGDLIIEAELLTAD